MERVELVLVCLAMVGFQSVFSLLWLTRFRLGPLEWVSRSVIYGKAQPLRRQAG